MSVCGVNNTFLYSYQENLKKDLPKKDLPKKDSPKKDLPNTWKVDKNKTDRKNKIIIFF